MSSFLKCFDFLREREKTRLGRWKSSSVTLGWVSYHYFFYI